MLVDSTSGGVYGDSLCAAISGRLTLLQLLIEEYNMDYKSLDSENRTALHIAACGKDPEMIAYLLNLGFDANQHDRKGWSAYHYAASTDTPKNLEVLLQHTSSVTNQLAQGWSPLHLACRGNGAEALDLLVKAGFQPSTVTISNPPRLWSLYDIAFAHGNKKLLSKDGSPKHCSLDKDDQRLEEGYKHPTRLAKAQEWTCDGCTFHAVSTHALTNRSLLIEQQGSTSFGPQYHCDTCIDFDYCFMCYLTAEQTHQHTFTRLEETNGIVVTFDDVFDSTAIEWTRPLFRYDANPPQRLISGIGDQPALQYGLLD
jgi:hypothetical protein